MGLPNTPVTLSVDEVAELHRKLSTMRHDINNCLSLVVAAAELVRYKPELAEKMLGTLGQQPMKISEAVKKFSAEFERIFGITRP